jgi:NADH-quinone oxidoreductase subunit N
LAIIGVLASVVGAYYYLRIIKIMYFDDAAPAFDKHAG